MSDGALDQTTVLIVDDDPTIRGLLAQVMSSLGLRCISAESAEQALSLYAEGRFRVIVTDINMPGLDGYGLAEQLRKQNSEAAIVAYSGGIVEDDSRLFDAVFSKARPLSLLIAEVMKRMNTNHFRSVRPPLLSADDGNREENRSCRNGGGTLS